MPKRDSKSKNQMNASGTQPNDEDRPLTVKNWDEWFQLCGTLVQPMQEYQDAMVQYFFHLKHNKNADEQADAQKEYQAKHKEGWYNDEPLLPPAYLSKVFIGGGVGLFLGIILGIVLTVGSENGISITAIIIGAVIGAILGAGIMWGIYLIRRNSIFSKFKKLEAEMHDAVMFIPPKYRNQQAIAAFYDVYCSYGIASFNQAVQEVDNYLVSNNLVGAYMAILFDLPYTNNKDRVSGNTGADSSTGNDTSNPALPPDIESKTYEGVDDPDEQLNELIGLDNVKTQIRQMKNRMEFYGGGDAEQVSGNHMVFLGPPGTGKTTVARIITRILYDFGYISKNQCVEVDGGYMKSPYVGQTPERVSAILDYAMGGVLFIDEAYILTQDKNGSAGAEAVGVLLKALEDHRNDFVCIMAGYEDDMNRMLASNEGFESRIKYKIYFDNFSTEELCEIFEGMLKNSGAHDYEIEPDGMELLKKHFAREREIPGFGNARVVRSTWDSLLDIHADAFQTGKLPENKRYVITKGDVEKYTETRSKQMTEDGRNFIASRNLDSSVISLQELKQKTKPGSEDPDKDLNALTGLEVVKDEVKKMKAQFSFYNGNMENTGNHMLFVGPPGTGKTTVAGIVTGYLYQMGLIRDNSYLDINGDFLRGMYLGHTGKRTEAVVQYAQGMVLFVDEAYLLTSNDGSADSFGQEAVGVLIDAMEKYRSDFVVIFAGYEKEMNDFLDVNSGLRSRISLTFHFTSYTPHELAEMFRNVAKADGFKVEKDVWVPMQKYFKTLTNDPHFGNGRFVRQFFEEVKKQHILNFAGQEDESQKYVISLQDVEPLIETMEV